MTPHDPDSQLSEIEEALFQGRKIEAIKMYREGTGVGLKEAKQAVEELEAELRATSPDKFKKPAGGAGGAGGAGCLRVVVLCALVAVAIAAAAT